jgi:hypothetical protein
MRVFGPNGFKGAAFIHDSKVVSATKNLGPCWGWPVARLERLCAARGWIIERDELPAEPPRADAARAGDR